MDWRIDTPETDGKTQNDHLRERRLTAQAAQHSKAKPRLFDSGYAWVDNLKLMQRWGLFCVTPLKAHRLLSRSQAAGYSHLEALEWTAPR